MTLSTRFRLAQTMLRRCRVRQRPFPLMCESLETRTTPAIFWVSNTNDSGAGSLRQAIISANAEPGADTVRFKSSTDGTITLTTGELSIAGDVLIDGRGSSKTEVSGDGKSRVLHVANGSAVTIRGLTVSQGSVVGTNGGGILNAGNLTLHDAVVSNNVAQYDPVAKLVGNGGGIWNTGTLSANNSQISGNKALHGSGLLNTDGGTAFLNKSTVSANFGIGAALRSQSGSTLTIRDSLITGNTGHFFGGGIASGGTLKVINSTISNNLSPFGAVYLLGSFAGGGPSGDVVISGSRIANNGPVDSFSTVGGILSSSTGHSVIEDCEITGNVGGDAGGIGAFSGTFDVIRSNISGNVGGSTGFAGGIMANYALTIVDSTISGNVGGTGGINSLFDTTIVRSTVSDNIGVRYGGVANFYCIAITDSTISGNTAIPDGPTYGAAGGVYVGYRGTISNSTISGNTVIGDGMQPPYFGTFSAAVGGVLVAFPGVSIDHSTIVRNQVTDAPAFVGQVAGGVLGVSSEFTMADVSIRNTIVAENSATNRDPDVTGSFQSQGHNLLGILTGGATGFVGSDLSGTSASPLDPQLHPLKNNGGPTFTHALKGNSPALNAGDNADAPPTDQRGQDRIVGGTIDIGAFEAQDDDDGNQRTSVGQLTEPAGSAPKSRTWLWTAPGEMSIFNSMFAPRSGDSRLHELDRDVAIFLGFHA